MGTASKAWLTITGLIALIGLAIYYKLLDKGLYAQAQDVLQNGAGFVGFMLFFWGLVTCMKYMADN